MTSFHRCTEFGQNSVRRPLTVCAVEVGLDADDVKSVRRRTGALHVRSVPCSRVVAPVMANGGSARALGRSTELHLS